MSYNKLIQQHFFEPSGVLSKADDVSDYRVINEGSVALGDALQFYVKMDEAHTIFEQLKFKAYGNPYVIAGMSYSCEQLQGKALSETEKFSAKHFIEIFELPKTKYYVAYMLEDVLQELKKVML